MYLNVTIAHIKQAELTTQMEGLRVRLGIQSSSQELFFQLLLSMESRLIRCVNAMLIHLSTKTELTER